MEEKNKRKSIIFLVIGIVTLIALVSGATYAYFQSQTKNGTSFNANVTAGTTDNLTFSINDLDVYTTNITDDDGNNSIVINATQQNFGEKANSLGDGVTGKAILIANDSTKEASYKYNVYVNIINNDLEYTSYKNETGNVKLAPLDDNDKTTYINPVPELIMTIRKNGTQYTNDIDGLTQTTITTKDGDLVTGYDITEVRRNILIEEATIEVVEGTKDLRTEDEWEISIILKNLETNQQLNTDKEVKGEVLIQKEKIEPIQDKLLADANKEGQEDTLLYHNGKIKIDGQVMDAEDYSYRCAGGDYKITSRYEDKYDSLYATSSSNDYSKKLIRFKCGEEEQYIGYSCQELEMYYYLNYNEQEHYSSIYEATKRALTDGYIEPNVNNYVCFGGPCSNNPEEEENYSNLYRIIGLFPTDASHSTYQMKIIKADYASDDQLGSNGANYGEKKFFFWNYSMTNVDYLGRDTNDWSKSNLNIENLNGYFLNDYLHNKDNGKWNSMIENHIWITEGNTGENIIFKIAKETYNYEIMKPDGGTLLPDSAKVYKAKVGLMYVSDYGYAAYKEAWKKILNQYNDSLITENNWMYIGLTEWTITPRTNDLNTIVQINKRGLVGHCGVSNGNIIGRPTMYLNSNVKIISGTGKSDDPYIISM